MDATDTWWPTVKRVRDQVAHREHTKMVFGSPKEGILFQIYDGGFLSPVVVHPALAFPTGHNIADFRLYAAVIVSEVLVFIDAVGQHLAPQIGLAIDRLTPSLRVGNFDYLLSPMNKLLATHCVE
jgi:hypothetical protein